MPTLSSTTSTKEEMEHALSENWREPFTPPSTEPATETPAGDETPPETTAAPETADDSKESKGREQPKKKSGWERRIDKLTALNSRLERELEEARKVKPAETKEAAPATQGPPQLKDFKTPEEWADARDVWKEEQAEKQAKAEEQKAIFDEYNKGVSEARGKHEDWDEAVKNSDAEIPQSVQLAIVEMGNLGPEVTYYLAQHPEVCDEMMQMRPLAAAARAHAIADTLGNPEPKGSPKPKPRVTPPEPIKTVGASSTRTSVPMDQLPIKDFMKIRNRQEFNRKHGR